MNSYQPSKTHPTYVVERRISNIDFLRGIAAISVLIWHYQHFYFGSSITVDISSQRDIQPLYSFLQFFYTHGHIAVQFFWILSGFVFFHVYHLKQDVGAKTFFSHRLARLYPIHLLTLFLVAILQFINIKLLGAFQIYQFNDLKHFILNLLFASHWGFQDGFSFNAPVWSVSVEVVVYFLFYAILKTFGINWASAVVWIAIAFFASIFFDNSIILCSFLFALGGVVNMLSRELSCRGLNGVGIATAAFSIFGLFLGLYSGKLELNNNLQYLLFSLLIFEVAAIEKLGYSLGKIGDEFGNITYSSYMIHVPMQLVAILFMDLFMKSREVIASPIFLIVYLASVLLASHFIYRVLEIPLKKMMLKSLNVHS